MGHRRSAFGAVAGAAVLLAGLAALSLREEPSPANGLPGETGAAVYERLAWRGEVPSDPRVGVGEGAHAVPAPVPDSLRGTEPDGALVVDASGAFVATPDALDLFDYYLAAFGEEPMESIVARIEAAIRARVDPPDEALLLLDQYLAYRDEVRRMVEVEGLALLPLERRLQLLRETRRSIFGIGRAEALFAADEARDRRAIAWQRVASDPSLGARERAERLAALEAEWPEAERERWERATVASRTLARESALREEGASEAEIQVLREQEFGVDAAARLAALDRSRQAWADRVERYREERTRIEARGVSDPAETDAEIEALRSRSFEGPELARIRALDAIERRGADGS